MFIIAIILLLVYSLIMEVFILSIGHNIKNLRLQHNLSQKEFAAIAGVSDKAVSTWENGTKTPRMGAIQKIADHFGLLKSAIIEPSIDHQSRPVIYASYKIPVLNKASAKVPPHNSKEIIGYESLNDTYRNDGYSYFALRMQGHSMEPTIMDGDTIIVRQQSTVDNGQIAVLSINGEDSTIKEVKKSDDGITLIGHNAAIYTPQFYSHQDIEALTLTIIGRVIEIRRSL